jgi:hypothetical protein
VPVKGWQNGRPDPAQSLIAARIGPEPRIREGGVPPRRAVLPAGALPAGALPAGALPGGALPGEVPDQVIESVAAVPALIEQVGIDQRVELEPHRGRRAAGQRRGRSGAEVVAGMQPEQPEQLPLLAGEGLLGQLEHGADASGSAAEVVQALPVDVEPVGEVGQPPGAAAAQSPGGQGDRERKVSA